MPPSRRIGPGPGTIYGPPAGVGQCPPGIPVPKGISTGSLPDINSGGPGDGRKTEKNRRKNGKIKKFIYNS